MAKSKSKNKGFRKKQLMDILKGDFLVGENAFASWKLIVFFIGVAFVMITSAHLVDNKVVEISKLKTKLEETKGRKASVHSKLMHLKVESGLDDMMASDSLFSVDKQPFKILVPKEVDGES